MYVMYVMYVCHTSTCKPICGHIFIYKNIYCIFKIIIKSTHWLKRESCYTRSSTCCPYFKINQPGKPINTTNYAAENSKDFLDESETSPKDARNAVAVASFAR